MSVHVYMHTKMFGKRFTKMLLVVFSQCWHVTFLFTLSILFEAF